MRKGIPRREILFLQAIESAWCEARLIVDVRANIGLFILVFADIFRNAKIIAFEPSQRTYSRIAKNLDHSSFKDHVSLENIALTDVDERGFFFDDPCSPATSHQAAGISKNGEYEQSYFATVDCLRLDTYCQLNSITHIDLLKIDVEGYEI
jgi:FkbM family methyltransferase